MGFRQVGSPTRALRASEAWPVLLILFLTGAPPAVRSQVVPPAYKTYGQNFSPYTDGQNPDLGAVVSEAQLRGRMSIVAQHTNWIRTFGTTRGLQAAGRIAREFGLKVAMGAWISNDPVANQAEIDNLVAAAKAGEVDLAIVGSEVMLRRNISEAQLISYIDQVRAQIPAAIPVTTADVYGELLLRPLLLSAVDVVMVNYYPYWEGYDVNAAVGAVHGWHQQVTAAAGGKAVYVSETGWPSGGNSKGNAVPSPENSAFYFLNFVSWARANNVPYFYFEALDETWKATREGPQGAHWGIWDKNGILKPGMQRVFDGETIEDNWTGNSMPGGPGTPSIEFTFVPVYGTSDLLEGRMMHERPADHKVAVYIGVPGWWTKPTFTQPLTPLLANGTFAVNITTGGSDHLATKIAAFLVPNGYIPPELNGDASLPAELYANSVANTEVSRTQASIRGRVLDAFGAGIGGASLALSGSANQMVNTVSSGKYSFFNLAAGGSYNLSASKQGFVIAPATHQVVSLASAHIADFTAAANQPPLAVSVSPASGTGGGQTFSFLFSDSNGFTDLGSMQIDIGATLTATNACYLYHARASNQIWLMNNAGSAWIGPLTVGGSGSVSNSQCALNAAGSSTSSAGNNLTLNLALSFQPGFAGTKKVHMLAHDAGNLSSGWQERGAWNISGAAANQPPLAVSVSPASGTGASQTFSFLFSDSNGFADLGSMQIDIGATLTATNACYLYHARASNQIWLMNDAGSAWIGPLTVGGSGSVSNSQCTLNAAASSTSSAGNNLTLNLALSFQPGFSGIRKLYMLAHDAGSLSSGWQERGSWTVP